MWTHFMDKYSGGGQKLDWEHIFIEAAEAEAKVIFYNHFKRNPERVTCTCCGDDYRISEHEDLALATALATAYERGCDYSYVLPDGTEKTDEDWQALPPDQRRELNAHCRYLERKSLRHWARKYQTLEDYMKTEALHFIPASHIKAEERAGSVPAEGFVWA